MTQDNSITYPYTKNEVRARLKKYNIANYIINSDLSVDINGDVNLSDKNLQQLPIKFNLVSGNFYCWDNKLTTLKWAPKFVGGNFYCRDNKLTTLKWAPKFVGGSLDCSYNELSTLEGLSIKVGKDFYCIANNLKLSIHDIKALCKISGDVFV